MPMSTYTNSYKNVMAVSLGAKYMGSIQLKKLTFYRERYVGNTRILDKSWVLLGNRFAYIETGKINKLNYDSVEYKSIISEKCEMTEMQRKYGADCAHDCKLRITVTAGIGDP